MDQRTRKLMTIQKALHPRDDIDWLYLSRKEGGRGHARTVKSVDTWIQRLEDHIKKNKESLITTTRNNMNTIKINREKITRKQKWEQCSCMGISIDNQAESHTRRFGHG